MSPRSNCMTLVSLCSLGSSVSTSGGGAGNAGGDETGASDQSVLWDLFSCDVL